MNTSSKLRVLTISKPYVSRMYRDKIRQWAKSSDLEVGLICPSAWGSQNFEVDDGNLSSDYSLVKLPLRLNGYNHFHYYQGLEEAIVKFAPDILNVEEEHYSAVTWQAYRIAVKHKIRPIFYTWQNIHKNYPIPFSLIEQFVFRHSAAAVAGNQEAADILRKKGFAGKLRIIPQMGVTTETFRPLVAGKSGRQAGKERLGLAVDKFWLVFAGRIVEEKGLDDLIAAISVGTSSKIAVAILGSGPHLGVLRQKGKELEQQGRLLFRAQVPSAEVPDYLRAADVMCLPSRTEKNWKEQFGRILIEAMAAEAVVLGSSSGEIPRVIADAGLTFKERDVVDLRHKINYLASHPKECERLREAGRKHVLAHFTSEIIADRFRELFLEVGADTGIDNETLEIARK